MHRDSAVGGWNIRLAYERKYGDVRDLGETAFITARMAVPGGVDCIVCFDGGSILSGGYVIRIEGRAE